MVVDAQGQEAAAQSQGSQTTAKATSKSLKHQLLKVPPLQTPTTGRTSTALHDSAQHSCSPALLWGGGFEKVPPSSYWQTKILVKGLSPTLNTDKGKDELRNNIFGG